MAKTQGHGNPAWNKDETLLALNLYLDVNGQVPPPRDPRVVALSELLRSLPYHSEAARQPTFRNPDGVGFKLMNIRQVATGKGLGNVSRMDRMIWSDYGHRPEEVRRLSEAICEGIALADQMPATETDEEFEEGRLLTQLHLRRERNPKLRAALLKSRWPLGLRCEMCDRHQPSLRAELQEAIFEAHHLVPVAQVGERVTRLSDVALLCACCHRLLHKLIATERRWVGITAARKMLAETEVSQTALL